MKQWYKKASFIICISLIILLINVFFNAVSLNNLVSLSIANNSDSYAAGTIKDGVNNNNYQNLTVKYETSYIDENGSLATTINDISNINNENLSLSSNPKFIVDFTGNINPDTLMNNKSPFIVKIGNKRCDNYMYNPYSTDGEFTFDLGQCFKDFSIKNGNVDISVKPNSSSSFKNNYSFNITNTIDTKLTSPKIDGSLKAAIDVSQEWTITGNLLLPREYRWADYDWQIDISNVLKVNVINTSTNEVVTNKFNIIYESSSIIQSDQDVQAIVYTIKLSTGDSNNLSGEYRVELSVNTDKNGYIYKDKYVLDGEDQLLNFSYISGEIDTSKINAVKYNIEHKKITNSKLVRYDSNNKIVEFDNLTLSHYSTNTPYDISLNEFQNIENYINGSNILRDNNGYLTYYNEMSNINYNADDANITVSSAGYNKLEFYIVDYNNGRGNWWDYISKTQYYSPSELINKNCEEMDKFNDFYNYVSCATYHKMMNEGYSYVGNHIVKDVSDLNINYNSVYSTTSLTGSTEFDYESPEKIVFSIPITTSTMNDRIYDMLRNNRMCSNGKDTNCYEIVKNTSSSDPISDGTFKIEKVRMEKNVLTFELIYHESDSTFDENEYGYYYVKFRVEGSLHPDKDVIAFSVPMSAIDYYLFTTSGVATFDDLVSKDVRSNTSYTFNKFDLFDEYSLSSSSTSSNYTSDDGYVKFFDDYNNHTNSKYKNYIKNAYNSFIEVSKQNDPSFQFNTMEVYKSFYDYLDVYYREYFDSGEEYISFNDVSNMELQKYITYGPPGNVKKANLFLGFYVSDGTNKKLLDSYDILYKIFPHNIAKKPNDKYVFYDQTRYKLVINDYSFEYDTDNALDKENSTIDFKVIKYEINSLVEETTIDYGTKSIDEFISTMKNEYQLDVYNAFTPNIEDPNLNIGTNLFDHLVKDKDDNIHFTYNTNGTFVSKYIDRGQYPENTDLSDGYLILQDSAGALSSVKGVSSETSYSDYYYLSNHADVEETDVVIGSQHYNGFKPENGSFVFNIKSYPSGYGEMTKEEIDNYGVRINVTTNKHCNSEALSKYSISNSSVVCYNDSTGDEYAYNSLADKNKRLTELVGENLTDEENKEKSALNGMCQSLEERRTWCSNSALDVAPSETLSGGTYFAFTGFGGNVKLDFITDDTYFPIYKYPVLAGNNSHMTKLSYSDPLYVMTFNDVIYSILGNDSVNDMKAAYANVSNDIKFYVVLNENDDDVKKIPEYMSEKIERFYKAENEEEAAWHELTPEEASHFNISTTYYNTIINETEASIVRITTNGNIDEGKYRLVLKYDNNDRDFHSREFAKEFNVEGKYFNVKLKTPDKSYYYRNVKDELKIPFKSAINVDFDNLLFKLKNVDMTNEATMNIEIGRKEDETSNTYTYGDTYVLPSSVEGTYDIYRELPNGDSIHEFSFRFNENNELCLTNVKNVLDVGVYQLKLSYIYNNNIESKRFVTASTMDFEVKDNRFLVELVDVDKNGKQVLPEISIDNNNQKRLSFYVRCSYIDKSKIDQVHFDMMYYDEDAVLVNGSTANPYPFERENVEILYDEDESNYVVKATFLVNEEENSGINVLKNVGILSYIFMTSYKETDEVYDYHVINNIFTVFDWKINSASLSSTTSDNKNNLVSLTGDEITSIVNGTKTNNFILYNNLKNQSIDIDLYTGYDKPIYVSVDKVNNTIASNTYNNNFIIENNSGLGNNKRTIRLDYLNNYNHVVKEGDTPRKLATKYNIPINDMLTYCNTSNEDKELTVGSEISIPNYGALDPGEYCIKLYYENNMMQTKYIYFKVASLYEKLEILDIKSTNMFLNMNGSLDIELDIEEISNIDDIRIDITDPNGVNVNNYFDGLFVGSYNKIHITKPSNENMTIGTYKITVKYTNMDGITFEDEGDFQIGEVYYDYNISLNSSDPKYLVKDRTGTIKYRVTTSGLDLSNTSTILTFVNNLSVYRLDNTGKSTVQTGLFRKSYQKINSNSFDIILNFNPGMISGVYYITTSYTKGGLTKDYDSRLDDSFIINDYIKSFEISNVEYINLPVDNQLHNNIDWGIKYHIISEDDIINSYTTVKILNSRNHDVTDQFEIIKNVSASDKYVLINYSGSKLLPIDTYYVKIIYDEDVGVEPFIANENFDLVGIYKQVKISKISQSSDVLYADAADQTYSLSVDTSLLTEDDLDNIYVRVFDSKNNLVYSNTPTDNLSDGLIIDDMIKTDGTMTLILQPYKFRVGKYYIDLCIPNEIFPDEYNGSNKLELDVNDSINKVNLSSVSINSIKKVNKTYNNLYDDIGAIGHVEFTTDYAYSDLNEFSIAIIKDLKVVDVINSSFVNTDGIISTDFELNELPIGNVEFAICINNLPYASVIKNVQEYIPIKNLLLNINGVYYSDANPISIPLSVNSKVSIFATPLNASDMLYDITISDENILTYVNDEFVPHNDGTVTVNVSNSGVNKTFTIEVCSSIESDVYNIDNVNKIIYINNVKKKQISKSEFVSNLINVGSSYIYTDVASKSSLNSSYIATGDRINVYASVYTVVFRGDCNSDGVINAQDYVVVKNKIMGRTAITNIYQQYAANANSDSGNVINAQDYVMIKNIIMGRVK